MMMMMMMMMDELLCNDVIDCMVRITTRGCILDTLLRYFTYWINRIENERFRI